MTKSTSGQPFFESLWEKRYVRIAVSYLLGAWAIIQFIDWMVNRYAVNQVWTDMALTFFILLFPAVLYFSYLQSEGKAQSLSLLQRFALAGNLVLALGASFYLFSQTEPTQNESVIVTDETGKEMERTVALRANNKRLVVFPILSENSSQEVDWKAFAIAKLLEQDLEQNRLLYVLSPFSLQSQIEQYDYTLTEEIPFGIALQIAEDHYSDYFLMGYYREVEGEMATHLSLYDTKTGREVASYQTQQTDIFTSVDDLARDVNSGIFTEDQLALQSFVDLPATELISTNKEGLRGYIMGHYAQYIDYDLEKALSFYKQGTEADPKSAFNYLLLGIVQGRMGDYLSCKENHAKALDLSQNLPERQQLNIKVNHYSVNNQVEKMERLLEMWMKLYPDDYFPYTYLLDRYWEAMDHVKIEQVAKKAIENGNYGAIHNTLFYSYLNQGSYEKAEEILDEFYQLFPEKAKKGTQRASLYLASGQFEKAEAEFERLSLLMPRNPRIIRSMGFLALRMGDFDRAIKQAEKSLEVAHLLRDTTFTYNLLIEAYRRQGKNNQAIALLDKKFEMERAIYPLPDVYAELFEPIIMQMFVDNGRLDEVRRKFEFFVQNFTKDNVAFNCMLEATFALFGRDNALFKKTVNRCEGEISQIAGNRLFIGMGISALYDQDYEKAIQSLEEYREKSGITDDYLTLGYLAQAYRLNGQADKAKVLIQRLLKAEPTIGKLRFELALIQHALGDTKAAKETLRALLNTQWKEADAAFIPAQVARAKLKEWETEI